MNSCLIGVKTLQFQLRATVQGPIAQFGWEGLLRRKTQSMPDSFKGRLPTIEEIEAGAGRGFGMSAEGWNERKFLDIVLKKKKDVYREKQDEEGKRKTNK